MSQNRIWNNKLGGLLPAVCIGFAVLLQKFVRVITSIGFRHGIASCGKNVRVDRGILYRYPGKIYIGDNVIIGHDISLTSENLPESKLVVKNDVSIGDRCSIDFTGGVTIGDGAHVAHNVRIISHDHGYNYKQAPIGKSLIIGSNAFVGSDVIILFNCNNVGANSVIGAGSVVTKDVPDNVVVAGNPARIIKFRDDI